MRRGDVLLGRPCRSRAEGSRRLDLAGVGSPRSHLDCEQGCSCVEKRDEVPQSAHPPAEGPANSPVRAAPPACRSLRMHHQPRDREHGQKPRDDGGGRPLPRRLEQVVDPAPLRNALEVKPVISMVHGVVEIFEPPRKSRQAGSRTRLMPRNISLQGGNHRLARFRGR